MTGHYDMQLIDGLFDRRCIEAKKVEMGAQVTNDILLLFLESISLLMDLSQNGVELWKQLTLKALVTFAG
ncbi:hypothetical protein RRF57_009068 [Xylaria bambusicola]|uniref:Uncharacterized protein n=1 Tax=Xylaria bambusicola TaxID=326684 RepID=A0AAN7UT31_9PEZI